MAATLPVLCCFWPDTQEIWLLKVEAAGSASSPPLTKHHSRNLYKFSEGLSSAPSPLPLCLSSTFLAFRTSTSVCALPCHSWAVIRSHGFQEHPRYTLHTDPFRNHTSRPSSRLSKEHEEEHEHEHEHEQEHAPFVHPRATVRSRAQPATASPRDAAPHSVSPQPLSNISPPSSPWHQRLPQLYPSPTVCACATRRLSISRSNLTSRKGTLQPCGHPFAMPLYRDTGDEKARGCCSYQPELQHTLDQTGIHVQPATSAGVLRLTTNAVPQQGIELLLITVHQRYALQGTHHKDIYRRCLRRLAVADVFT